MKVLRKLVLSAVVAAAMATFGDSARATVLHFEGTGFADGAIFFFKKRPMPLDFSFDVEIVSETPRGGNIRRPTGTVRWNDGQDRLWTVNGKGSTSTNSNGHIRLSIRGGGVFIGTARMDLVNIVFDVGEDPFTSTRTLSSLLLGASVVSMETRLFIDSNSTAQHRLRNVSGGFTNSTAVDEVPTPALLSAGLLGAMTLRRRRARRSDDESDRPEAAMSKGQALG